MDGVEVTFCFCLTVSLPLPFFFSAPTTQPRHNITLTHTHYLLYNMTHWCTPSHASRAVCCAAFFFSQSFLLASASEPAGSVPSTQSQKREVGTIALWSQARVCGCILLEELREDG